MGRSTSYTQIGPGPIAARRVLADSLVHRSGASRRDGNARNPWREPMTYPRYPTLLAAAIAAAFIGVAAAQTQSDDSSRMPAKKGMAQESQTQPSTDQPDKMKGQDQAGQMKGQQGQDASSGNAMASDQKSKSDKSSSKKTAPPEQATKQPQASSDSNKQAMDSGKKDKQAASSSGAGNQAMDKSNTQAMNAAKQGAKSKRSSEEAGAPDEKAYRDALRDCAKQADETQRGSCLDSAIERF